MPDNKLILCEQNILYGEPLWWRQICFLWHFV